MNQEPIELIFHEVHDHHVNISDLWIQEVEQRCQGQVHFTKYVGRELPSDCKVDVWRQSVATGGKYLLMDLIQMPFVTRKSLDGSRILAQLYKEFEEFRQETSDVKVCGLGTGSLMGIFSTEKWGPIKSLEDLKGSRCRSILPFDSCLTAIGSEPVHVNYLELKEDMKSGKMQCALLGLLPALTFNLVEEVAPYCALAVEGNISTHAMRLAMTWEAWNKLPEDVQKAIDEIGPAGGDCWFANHNGTDFDANLEDALNYIRKHGQISLYDESDLDRCIDLMQPGVEERIRIAEEHGLPGRKFYDRLLELSWDPTF